MPVYRCCVSKKAAFGSERAALLRDLSELPGVTSLKEVLIFNRYDVEGISPETYEAAKKTVFAEPPCDDVFDGALPEYALEAPCRVLAVESLPGQFDQRADSCASCIQLMSGGDRPTVASARVYVFRGELSDAEFDACRGWLINPVECREASMEIPETLKPNYGAPAPVPVLEGFIGLDSDGLRGVMNEYGLAMDLDDITFLQGYFRDSEKRDPSLTELRVLDTYWSDHCRHTTFSTRLTDIKIEDETVQKAFEQYLAAREEVYGEKAKTRPITLMDLATIGAKTLKKRGVLKNLDESEEINACTVKIEADNGGEKEKWLLLFKNETHNHPTEIEPFGGAATCLGGAIRDPLSGRAYVYQAMRVTGAGDPTGDLSDTLPGKLPQRRLTRTAAKGYSSYGNQIGLATGLVDEIYHPGYVAKRLEIGAVVGAAPEENVIRKVPQPGDIVVVLGGRTGRDGCGGATGSSKSHSAKSVEVCGAEVQKGNAPEERKLQRLFRDPAVTRLIKRCNDFGAGGVSVAIGELAPGLHINLNKLPKKYEGLTGTELAISESQERMAVVVAAEDVEAVCRAANRENIEASVVAEVTAEPRLVMELDGRRIVDVARSFLDSNGAPKSAEVLVPDTDAPVTGIMPVCGGPAAHFAAVAADLSCCSRRGLGEMFDSTIGAASVLSPYGGKYQLTPTQCMAALLPCDSGKMNTCSVMSYGFDPYLSEQNPYAGAVMAVTESLAKLTAAGADINNAYFTFQEYFERLRTEPTRWGKPFAALLGALSAQLGYGVGAIGGKDSMSGSFEDLDVPPTLVSFAIAATDAKKVISPEFKAEGNYVCLFAAPADGNGMPVYDAVKSSFARVHGYISEGRVLSAFALGRGGLYEALPKMCAGNGIGFEMDASVDAWEFGKANCGAIVVESAEALPGAVVLGRTIAQPEIRIGKLGTVKLDGVISAWQSTLEKVFPTKAPVEGLIETVSYAERNTARPLSGIKPTAVIPVFPGTNCEYDTEKAVRLAGGSAKLCLVRNLTPADLEASAEELLKALSDAQMLIFPGGFSGGDEPDGSGKFIVSFFRNPRIAQAVNELLNVRGGLALGICNGFQALIKLGLVPYGEILDATASSPTLTFNAIGSHRSRYVTTRVASVKSPWLAKCTLGEQHVVPISHGEGRFTAPPEVLSQLIANGQVAFQYVDAAGNPTYDTDFNPAGSLYAIEGITSPDGRVLGKMAHTERRGEHIGINVPGNKHQPIFEAGVEYFL